MARIRHIAITAENPFVTAELLKRAFDLQEIGRGDSDLAREVYLTDGSINLAGIKFDLSSHGWPVAAE
jgi:hypothetical protein